MDIVYLVLIWICVSVVASVLIAGTLSQNVPQGQRQPLDSKPLEVTHSAYPTMSESSGIIFQGKLRKHLKPAIFLLIVLGLCFLTIFEVFEAVVSAM